MANSPRFKVHDAKGVYQASCKEIEAAATVVSFYGEGATIRDRNTGARWVEGRDGTASASYDFTMRVLHERIYAAHRANMIRMGYDPDNLGMRLTGERRRELAAT